jgi:RNA polymerase sigma-70 factor (ECF subfamily)
MSDGELVRQALAGQRRAFEELVHRWSGRVTAVCHARLGHADAVEDLAQEALMRAYRGLATLAEPEKFGSWLCGIAVRACLDWLKAKERTQVPFSVLAPNQLLDNCAVADSRAAASDRLRADEMSLLMAQVEALPEEYREVVMLYYYEDVTYRELAELLGVSTATVNARLTKARALLRQRLGKNVGR